MNHLWFPFIAFAALILGFRIMSFMLKSPANSKFGRSFFAFFGIPDDGELASVSILQFLFVWLLGSIYIEKMSLPWTETLSGLPDRYVIACSLGAFGEFIGPLIIKIIVEGVLFLAKKWFGMG